MGAWLILGAWLVPGLVPGLSAQEHEAHECGGDEAGAAESESLELILVDGGRAFAPLLHTDIELRVTGMIARGTLRQEFRNPTESWVEGIYRFPLPAEAAVDGLRMVVGDLVIEGQIQEKEEARRTYAQARAQGQRASLVEQERPNLFTTQVANIAPGAQVEILLEFQFTVRYDLGRFSIRVPTVAAPRYLPPPSADTDAGADAGTVAQARLAPSSRRGNLFELTLDLDAGMDLAFLDSPTHAIEVDLLARDHARVRLAEGAARADADFELVWEPVPEQAPRASVFTQQRDGETFFLLMVVPPVGAGAPRLSREVVLVIDTSGSMHGASIEQARKALETALAGLQDGDTFNLIQFNSTTSSLFPESQPVTAASLEAARSYVRTLSATGGTDMLPALAAALEGEAPDRLVRQVLFVTDGAVGNEGELFAYLEANLDRSRLFTVGIGSAPNGHFMERAAALGRGTFTYISDLAQVEERMVELLLKLESPALTEIEVRWPGAETEAWPARIPDLYAGEPVLVTTRTFDANTLEGPGKVEVRGLRGEETWQVSVAVAAGEPAAGIDKLWARRKIRALLRGEAEGEEGIDRRQQVLDVALRYGLTSPYTSLVAVDVTPVRPPQEALARGEVPAHLPRGWQPEGAVGELPQGATAGPLWNALGFLLLAFAFFLRPRRRIAR